MAAGWMEFVSAFTGLGQTSVQVACDAGAVTVQAALNAAAHGRTPLWFEVSNPTGSVITINLGGTWGTLRLQPGEVSPRLAARHTVAVFTGGGAGDTVDVLVTYDPNVQA